jgi:hypothetical protein
LAPPTIVNHQSVVTYDTDSIPIKNEKFIFCKEKSGGKSEGGSGCHSPAPKLNSGKRPPNTCNKSGSRCKRIGNSSYRIFLFCKEIARVEVARPTSQPTIHGKEEIFDADDGLHELPQQATCPRTKAQGNKQSHRNSLHPTLQLLHCFQHEPTTSPSTSKLHPKHLSCTRTPGPFH